MSEPSLLLFDAEAGGHHPEYIHHLLTGLKARGHSGKVTLAVPQGMLDAHPEFASFGAQAHPLRLEPLPTKNPWSQSAHQWDVLEKATEELPADRVLLLYADTLLPTLAKHRRLPGHPELATIHFRPPVREPGARPRERIRDVVKRSHTRRVLAHPDLRAAFTLDPRALPFFEAHAKRASVHSLPDPVSPVLLSPEERERSRQANREAWGVEPGRHLMILFGVLEARKGIFKVLEALRALPDAWASRLAVAFVGRVVDESQEDFRKALSDTGPQTGAQLIAQLTSVRDERAVQEVLASADTILIPYQRHIGSSGVLIRAAALGIPVVCQDYGIIGEWTRLHRLGSPIDTTDATKLCQAIRERLEKKCALFDPETAATFYHDHSPVIFADKILSFTIND